MPSAAPGFRVDVVAAVRDEEATIPAFVAALDTLALPEGCDLGVIFVEDSSRDSTRALLDRLSADRPEIGYYALAAGFGQGPAIIFGASRSTADAVVMMDVDGGHPTEAIPEMIRACQSGAKVVQCVRRNLAGRALLRRLGTTGFRAVLRLLAGSDFRLHSIYYRLVTREVLDEWLAMPRYWRFLRFPLLSEDGALSTLEVDAAERSAGESKYGLRRLLGLGVDGVVSLLTPVRVAVWSGIVLLAAALLVGMGAWSLGLVLAVAALALVKRSRDLDRFPLLDLVRVEQSRPREARRPS